MLRRWTLLAVLLLTLSVIAPAVLACDSGEDCCPTQGAPCGSDGNQSAVCAIGTSAAAAINSSARQCFDAPGSDTPESIDLHSAHAAMTAVMSGCQRRAAAASAADPPQITLDEQRLYLQTGRLRL